MDTLQSVSGKKDICRANTCTTIDNETPKCLISLSSEFLIKHESDINTLIFLLQQKFQMSREKLEQWRAKIVFEF